MNVNITKLECSLNMDDGDKIRSAVISFQCSRMEYPINHYLLPHEFVPVIRALNGTGPEFTSQDGSYISTFHSSGIHSIKLNSFSGEYQNERESGRYLESWIEFPAGELALQFGLMVHQMNVKYKRVEFGPDDFYHWKCQYSPRIKLDISAVKNTLYTDLIDGRLKEPGIGLLSHLTRIAKNHSSGNLVTVTVSYEFPYKPNSTRPNSYYFDIRDSESNERVMNGGLIYHESDNRYSLHT